MPAQRCPNCQTEHDVSIYVSGQRILCSCGIRFEVSRPDVSNVKTNVDRPDGKADSQAPLPPPVPEAQAGAGPGVARVAAGASPEGGAQTLVVRPITIPGFEMVELLGRGGMGEVWRARQLSLSRFVAIKVLARNLSGDEEFVARFAKEAAALAALSHPNIVQIIDRGVSDSTYYFVMELVEGRSLREVMGAGRVPQVDALRIVSQICRAMDYAHERGIIHRDLKPENILLDVQGNVKVADFGLAGMTAAEPRFNVTRASTAMGTLHYMAPEQRRDARAVDGRADVYSVGVILYELLTGEVPLGRFKLPSARMTGVDPRVDAIIEKALEPEPAARFARASMVYKEIESLITTQPHIAPKRTAVAEIAPSEEYEPPRPVASGVRRQRRRRNFRFGMVLVGVAAGVLGTRAWLQMRGPSLGRIPTQWMPKDTHQNRSLQAIVAREKDGTHVKVDRFEEGPSPAPAVMSFHSGEWTYRDGALHARVYEPATAAGRFRPSAYLESPRFDAKGLAVEMTATVEMPRPLRTMRPNGEAVLFFRAGSAEIAMHAAFPADQDENGTFYRASWRFIDQKGEKIDGDEKDTDQPDEEEISPPELGKPFHLKLQISPQNLVEGFADGKRFFVQQLRGVSLFKEGHVGFDCRNAVCRFTDFEVSGHATTDPGAAQAHHEEPSPQSKAVEAPASEPQAAHLADPAAKSAGPARDPAVKPEQPAKTEQPTKAEGESTVPLTGDGEAEEPPDEKASGQ